MDLPSHAFWTYALEKIALPEANASRSFLFFSLLFAVLPDLIHDTPYAISILWNKKKLGLKNIKDAVRFAYDINHNRPAQYQNLFPLCAQLSFYSHSFLIYSLVGL